MGAIVTVLSSIGSAVASAGSAAAGAVGSIGGIGGALQAASTLAGIVGQFAGQSSPNVSQPAPIQVGEPAEAPTPATTLLTADTTQAFEDAEKRKRLLAQKAVGQTQSVLSGEVGNPLTQKATLLGQ